MRGSSPHAFSSHLGLKSSLFALLPNTNESAPWASETKQCEEAKSYRSKLVFKKNKPGIQNWGRCAGDEKCSLILLQHNDELALLFQNQAQAPLFTPIICCGLQRHITILIHCVTQFGQLNELTFCPLNGIAFNAGFMGYI